MNKLYKEKYSYKMIIVVLFTSIFMNGVAILRNMTSVSKVTSMINIVLALHLGMNRDTYLPFLGDCAIPTSVITGNRSPPKANVSKIVSVPPRTKVIYWASESNDKVGESPWKAYNKYDNAGVTFSNEEGKAKLVVRHPQAYKIPSGKTIESHIHYRYQRTSGMFSKIYTVYI